MKDESTLTTSEREPEDHEYKLGSVGSAQTQLIALIARCKDEAKSRKMKIIPKEKMSQFLNVYKGEQWPEVDFSPYTKWKTRQVVNFTGGAIDFIVSFILEQCPHPYCVPPDEKQEPLTDLLQKAIDDVWEQNNMDSISMQTYLTTAFATGTAVKKVYFDPLANEGEGEILLDDVDPRDVYIDPNCGGNLKKARYIIWEKWIPWEEAMRRFPSFGRKISHSLTTSGEPMELEYGTPRQVFFNSTATQSMDLAIFSPVNSPNTYENEAYMPNQSPTKVKVTEAWLKDMTKIKQKNEDTGETEIVDKYTHNIRLATVIGNYVVQDTSTPYIYLKGFPYVLYLDKPLPFETYGAGTISQVWPSQMAVNVGKSAMLDNQKMTGNPIWVIDKEAEVKTSALTNAPGLVVLKSANGKAERLPGVPNNEIDKRMIEDSIKEISELSGATDVLVGKKPKGTRSAEQQLDLKDSAQGPLRLKLNNLKKSISEMGSIILSLIQQYFTDIKLLRIMGDYGQATYLKFTGNMLEGKWTIHVESMPGSAATRQARLDQGLKLYSMDLLPKEEVLSLLDWPNRAKILKKMAQAQQAYEQAISQGQAKPKTGKKQPKPIGVKGV